MTLIFDIAQSLSYSPWLRLERPAVFWMILKQYRLSHRQLA
uniref:Uncharacterized protein n=1 Tax=Anguilla anguilla TaxID=7936 RepID=A0A0E9V108_ANGAN